MQIYDQREDLELERRRMLKEILNNLPNEGNLINYQGNFKQYDKDVDFDQDDKIKGEQQEESKNKEEEEDDDREKGDTRPYKYKLLNDFSKDEIKRRRLLAFTAF